MHTMEHGLKIRGHHSRLASIIGQLFVVVEFRVYITTASIVASLWLLIRSIN